MSYEPTPKPVSSTVPQLYMNPIHIQYVAVLVSVRYTLQQVLPSNAKYNHTLIEKCVSLFKRRRTHRNVIDFDSKYLSDANLKNLISKMCKPEVKSE